MQGTIISKKDKMEEESDIDNIFVPSIGSETCIKTSKTRRLEDIETK